TFVEKLAERMAGARPGDDRESAYGPMTLPAQADVVEDHIADALARGGRAGIGGMQSIRRPYVDPVLRADGAGTSMAGPAQAVGPTLTVTKVADLDEGVALANSSRYALGSTVFAGSKKRGLAAARAMRSGMTAINSVIGFATVPALPFGGNGDSGFGRIHGPDGLREFTRAKSIPRVRMRSPLNLATLSRRDKGMTRLLSAATLLHGKRYR